MLYFIESPYKPERRKPGAAKRGAIKIGYTESLETFENRLWGLQIGNPHELVVLAVCPGTRADERALHVRLAGTRIRGEWFKYSGALGKAISRALEADWHSEVVSAPEHSHVEAPLAPCEAPTDAVGHPESVGA